jgi:SH3-like domain-containing protein
MAALPTRAAITPPTAARTLTPTLDATTAPLQNLTPTHTLIPSQTPTVTITPAPTPVWAQIYASNDSGALIRSKPNGDILTSVMNGALVQVLGDTVKEDYRIWIKVRTTTGKEGWILQSLLVTATPSAGW